MTIFSRNCARHLTNRQSSPSSTGGERSLGERRRSNCADCFDIWMLKPCPKHWALALWAWGRNAVVKKQSLSVQMQPWDRPWSLKKIHLLLESSVQSVRWSRGLPRVYKHRSQVKLGIHISLEAPHQVKSKERNIRILSGTWSPRVFTGQSWAPSSFCFSFQGRHQGSSLAYSHSPVNTQPLWR